jgi:diadenosine tetraphosphatase ApaH/serine/threonine PP2A family protein phosphatase
MRLALIADIHANLHALEAVLDAIAALGPDRVVCLGDLVGYNAEPGACVARVRSVADVVVAGNHDRAAVGDEVYAGTNAAARSVIAWTRAQLDEAATSFLRGLPGIIEDRAAGFTAVHGCYLNDAHTHGYVTSTMVDANLRVLEAHRAGTRVGFCGHTHVPMIAWAVADRRDERRLDAPARWPRDVGAVLVNPGSVGQPRDGDPRAAFAIVDLDDRRAEIRRVAYDVEGAAHAIARAGLPGALGERLREGR